MCGQSSADELSRELRTGQGFFLNRRRKIVELCLFSSATLAGIALYQIGVLKKLPEPGWRGVDAGKVNGSTQAYSILKTPDALLGIASYGVTACLAGSGSADRAHTDPLRPIAMGLKVLADATLAAKLTSDECRKYRALSLWSLLTAAATWVALPLAIPETTAAVRHLIGKNA
jgi:Vitamin K epoxide reductase family